MFFKQHASQASTLSYFFGCGGQGVALAADVVAGDEAWFIAQAEQAKVRITHVVDTHVHADHFSGGRNLAASLGVPYYLHEYNQGRVSCAFQPLADGQIIELGNVQVKVLHTPGHTLDSVSLVVTDRRRGDAPWFVLTGDTLFVGAVGRPDLLGKEQELASQLFDSLHTKLLSLADETEVYPGHQAGSVCGAGLSGKPSSTIGFEKRWNPALTIKDKTEFVSYVLSNIPPRPDNMDRIIAANTAA